MSNGKEDEMEWDKIIDAICKVVTTLIAVLTFLEVRKNHKKGNTANSVRAGGWKHPLNPTSILSQP